MGMSVNSGGGGGRRGRRALNAEINVTPFVDVMLVLLIVFMITAPLLTKGVDVSLPNEAAEPLPASQEAPLKVSIDAQGQLFIQQTPITYEELIPQLRAIAGEGYEERIYLSIDQSIDWGEAAKLMTAIQRGGYRNLAMLMDPKARLESTGEEERR